MDFLVFVYQLLTLLTDKGQGFLIEKFEIFRRSNLLILPRHSTELYNRSSSVNSLSEFNTSPNLIKRIARMSYACSCLRLWDDRKEALYYQTHKSIIVESYDFYVLSVQFFFRFFVNLRHICLVVPTCSSFYCIY